MFLAHLTCVVVGFGSSFVYPFLGNEAKKRRGVQAQALSEASLATAKIITTPMIYAAGAFGLALAALGPYSLSDAWLSASMAVFLVAVLIAGFLHVPNLKQMTRLTVELAAMGPPPAGAAPSGPPPRVVELEARGKKAGMYGGILHLTFLVLMVLMIWKPGA